MRRLSRAFAPCLLALLVLLSASPAQAKYASIIIDAESGAVLHKFNADTKNHPASLTKIMTLYLTFEALKNGKFALNTPLMVSKRASGQTPSKLGLKKGQTITVENAILALVTKSANDVATVLAEAIGKSEVNFARMMTRKAREIGMSNTTFRNASGLPHRGQLSTARDIAILARALVRGFPRYYRYFSTTKFTYGKRTYRNHNTLLKTYLGADGIKTGYIRASGFNLAASAVRNGRRLIGVVMGGRSAKSRNIHMAELLDKGFLVLGSAAPGAAVEKRGKQAATGKTKTAAREVNGKRNLATSSAWGIQVGAFSRFAPAHLAAMRAARRLPKLLNRMKVIIHPITEGNATVYRARLMGLSESLARNACLQLQKEDMRCVAVPPQ